MRDTRKSTNNETYATEVIGKIKRKKQMWMCAFWIMMGVAVFEFALLLHNKSGRIWKA